MSSKREIKIIKTDIHCHLPPFLQSLTDLPASISTDRATRTHNMEMEGTVRSRRIAHRNATAEDSTTRASASLFTSLPTEIRLSIAEAFLSDFFARLTIGLYPPFYEPGEGRLPHIQELFSLLHVDRAFREETIHLCTTLAIDSAQEVVRHPPRNGSLPSIRYRAHEQLKAKHKKILQILQRARGGADDAGAGVDVPDDLLRALNASKRKAPDRRGRTQGRKRPCNRSHSICSLDYTRRPAGKIICACGRRIM